MSNIKIVTDGFGRPKPVKEENLYEYGLGVDGEPLGGGESGPYHANILFSSDDTATISVSPATQSAVSVDMHINSSSYINEAVGSRIIMYGANYWDENTDINAGTIVIQSGSVLDDNWEYITATGATIFIEGATKGNGFSGGGSVSISSGAGNPHGTILLSPGSTGGLFIYGLPTSDPHQQNRVWADSSAGYVLKVSQG